MNEAMYRDPATQANLATLRGRGYEFVDPERGFLAERESGVGRLASEERLLEALERALGRRRRFAGNASRSPEVRRARVSTRYGSSATPRRARRPSRWRARPLCAARRSRCCSGPRCSNRPPASSRSRHDRAGTNERPWRAPPARTSIAAAAVADWRPAEHSASKLHEDRRRYERGVWPNPDVLAALGERKGSTFLVGFAAETDEHEERARAKLRRSISMRSRSTTCAASAASAPVRTR